MYGLSYHNMPAGIKDYASAFRFWEKSKCWRGETGIHEPRKMRNDTSKRNKSVCLGNDDQVMFRYHDTYMVTYYADGVIGIDPYHSKSSTAFAGSLLPPNVDVNMNHPCGCVLMLRDRALFKREYAIAREKGIGDFERGRYALRRSMRTYVMRSEVCIKPSLLAPSEKALGTSEPVVERASKEPEYEPCNMIGFSPITEPTVDRAAAKEALAKHHFHDFSAWMYATLGIMGLQGVRRLRAGKECMAFQDNQFRSDPYGLLNLLDDGPAGWHRFLFRTQLDPITDHAPFRRSTLTVYDPTAHARKIVKAVRLAVYNEENVVTVHERPFVGSLGQLESCHKRQGLYGV